MNILVIAPHRDDEVIGVGGTIAKHISQGDCVNVCVITHGVEPICNLELDARIKEECIKANKILGVNDVIFLNYPAAMLETVPRHELNNSLIQVVQKLKPDIVYIPHRGDMQLDHKLTVDAAMVALRPKYKHVVKRIYAYETLSETGWDVPDTTNAFIPTVYNEITDYIDIKIEAMQRYTSQLAEYPSARSAEAIRYLAMYRGSTVNVVAAEAFSLIREIL